MGQRREHTGWGEESVGLLGVGRAKQACTGWKALEAGSPTYPGLRGQRRGGLGLRRGRATGECLSSLK